MSRRGPAGTNRTARFEEKRLTRLRIVLVGVAFAAAGFSYAPSGVAQASVAVTVDRAPPKARYERVPPPRAGYQWASGYWRWDAPGQRFAWIGGYWVQRRGGQRYVTENWMQQHGHWQLQRGHWER